jgi:hypothetical protein
MNAPMTDKSNGTPRTSAAFEQAMAALDGDHSFALGQMVAHAESLERELDALRGQPWPWQDQAFAYLGFCRDRMPSEHVTVVQNFINSSRATPEG